MQTYQFLIEEEFLLTQQTFRVLLQAMSHPGKVYSLNLKSESGLISVIKTLLDQEVTFYLADSLIGELEQTIIKATGSRPAGIEDADFLIIPSGNSNGLILRAKRGVIEYPNWGATFIYYVTSLSLFIKAGMREDLRIILKGPGINGEIKPFIGGIKKEEFDYLKEINSEYPLGVDSIFIDGANRIMCIPRSTRIIL